MAKDQSVSGENTLEDLIKNQGLSAWKGMIDRARELNDIGVSPQLTPVEPGTPIPDPHGLGRKVRISTVWDPTER